MEKQHILVEMNEANKVLAKFIGSEEYNKIISSIENNAKSGFITGISYAMILIMSECKNYYAVEKTDEENI